MAKVHTAFVVGVTLLAGAPTPAAQEPTVPPVARTATTTWLVPPGKDPFGNVLFVSPRRDRTFPRAQGRDSIAPPSDNGRARIVCGMIVVPVKPDSDPKMVMSPRPDSRVEYKIRTVAPRVCRE
jgi:hypothetical protein